MKTKVISAFPASGKTHLCSMQTLLGKTILDSDSSKFSWVLNEFQESTGIRNQEFPANYIKHIKENIGEVDYIMVSSHDDVKKALEDANIEYTLVMPEPELKEEWIGRCWLRGSPESFIRLINSMWSAWTDPKNLSINYNPKEVIFLTHGQYLADVI